MAYTGNANSFNQNSFNTNTIIQVPTPVADDKAQLLQWLSPLEPRQRHKHIRESQLDGIGEWIFRTNEFQRWNTAEDGSTHSVLFCHGDPGVGKTHLSSRVIDHFQGSEQDITVTALYCDYLDKKEQTTSNIIGAILKQVVGDGNIPEDMRKAFEVGKRHLGGVGPRTSELLKMLKAVLAQRQRVVICVDGLDESLPDHRTGLLKALREIIQELPNIQLFLTARPFILDEIKRYFTHMDTISVTPSKDDVKILLKTKLEEDPEPDAMDDHLRAQIMETIPEKVSEIFLLVSLTIEAILGETTIHRRREKLEHMTNGQDVGDVYTATLDRIKAQKKDRSRLGMEAIMWISHSERPLRPEELCQALGVQLQSEDLNNDNQPTIRTILSCGLGLITLDSSSATVRLVHFTLQEYILANPTLFHSPHSMIAEVCLTYLNYQCIRDLPPTLWSPPPTTPFLEYASCHWGAHARRGTTQIVKQLVLRLLQQFDAHIACKLLSLNEFTYFNRGTLVKQGRPLGFTALHGAAFFGVQEIMIALLGIKDWDLNATDINGGTVFSWAARRGHDGIVKMLLERNDVDPNRADNSGQTPLSMAVENGHEGTVKMLLERNDIDFDRADWDGRTPFSFAAGDGCEGIVELLLEGSDIDPGRADKKGQTPFLRAAKGGHGGVVKMLLERNDIDPGRADSDGRTPFSLAVERGHVHVVKLLEERRNLIAKSTVMDESAKAIAMELP
ncbi:ankyrin [Choiromyces venosus 120613-1]|uniref:Ankyrin n=1 Tax=Choiromyces venosus 120613-1 TaxID=1336337 RepID=A0A3N4J0K5_9PEZI|nr:ankyrin [Choiromyces venosus 120613-1]